MMRELSLKAFKAGEIAERYAYIPDNFIVFSKYQTITNRDIERAQKYNFDVLYYVDEDASAAVPKVETTEEEEKKLQGLEERPEAERVEQKKDEKQKTPEPQKTEAADKQRQLFAETSIYGNAVTLMHKQFSLVSGGNKVDIASIYKLSSIIQEYVLKNQIEALVHVSRGSDKLRNEVHAINTAILTTMTSYYSNVRGRELIHFITAALLHDIGILFVKDINSVEEIRKHTIYGFQQLKSIKNVAPAIVMAALQHHEDMLGSGYPNKVSPGSIELSSRIISVCDRADNQISYIKYGKDISIHLTKDEFLSWKKEHFDQSVLAAFITSAGNVFRRELLVQLNNGCLAIIKKLNLRFPLNPVIQVITDRARNKLAEPMTVDLIRTKDIWIKAILKVNS